MAKTKKRKSQMARNTKLRNCKSSRMTSCCPHMPRDEDGLYATTSSMKELKYRGKSYKLHTCCMICSQTMNELAKKDPDAFDKKYKVRINRAGSLELSNQHTGKLVQIARLMTKIKRTKRKSHKKRGGSSLFGCFTPSDCGKGEICDFGTRSMFGSSFGFGGHTLHSGTCMPDPSSTGSSSSWF